MREKKVITTNNKVYSMDNQGSLGLLALGDIGLKSWREVRGEVKLIKKQAKSEKLIENGRKTKR